jgi:hypothetical protein
MGGNVQKNERSVYSSPFLIAMKTNTSKSIDVEQIHDFIRAGKDLCIEAGMKEMEDRSGASVLTWDKNHAEYRRLP